MEIVERQSNNENENKKNMLPSINSVMQQLQSGANTPLTM